MSIPRIVHSAWFGGNPKPPRIQSCQESWRQQLMGYEFREWNEDSFNVGAAVWTRAAYASRKWAYITDYLRLWALYHHGGIYLDADVEVLRPLDRFLAQRAFTGHEADKWWLSATMGAEPGHPWIKMLLEHYETAEFDGLTPNTQVVTRLSEPWLIGFDADGTRYLREGVVIYPTNVFTPYDHPNLRPTPTEESYCIHHFCGSWLNDGKGRL